MINGLRNKISRFRKKVISIWEQEGSPGQQARGLAVGVFSGCFPLFGFQTVLGLCLATSFKGNRFLAILGTWISNPITYLPLYWFNFKVGIFLLGKVQSVSVFSEFSLENAWDQGILFSSRLLLGSLCVGIFSGFFFGTALYSFLKKNNKKRRFKEREFY